MKKKEIKWWGSRKKGWWRALRNMPVFWMHQRTRYMDRSELMLHLFVNVILFLIIISILIVVCPLSNLWILIIIALVGARTLSYFLNDNFWGGLQMSFSFIIDFHGKQLPVNHK